MTGHADSLSDRDLNRLCSLIYEQSGIKLTADKKIMLEGRLKRRMTRLKLASYREYCEYLFARNGPDAGETVHLIDAVTTNKTDFFREKTHFDFLAAKALPDLMARNESQRELLVWSAGCSTGEEPYTLAMVLNEYKQSHPGFRFRVLATDICTKVLAKAKLGVFNSEVVAPVPADLQRRYFMRSRDRRSDLLRVIPELREMVEFRRLNLMDDFGASERADAIFCRNVIIYFDRPTQERLLQKLSCQLIDGGYIFVGHSENLHHMDLPLVPVAPALYTKPLAKVEAELPEAWLQPGEFCLARRPTILKTLLGSCVGVTFWSQRLGAGALCHGVLPKCPPAVRAAEGYRYVDFAICDLARRFEALGVLRSEVQIKVFGGADVLAVSATSQKTTVGEQNWQTALEVLRDQDFKVSASDLGGSVGRTIQFHTGTGEVLLRRLSQLSEE